MAQTTYTVEIQSEEPGVYHIPGQGNMQQTLCGWVDAFGQVDHSALDHPCNCRNCIDMLNKIKALRFPKHYFETN